MYIQSALILMKFLMGTESHVCRIDHSLFPFQLYRTLSVRVVAVHVTTWTTGDRIVFPADNDPNILLDRFRDYEPQITAEHDSTMLIT